MSWHPWFAIPGVPQGTRYPVTAINRTSDHIDLFATGPDGGSYSAYWDIAAGWSEWFRIDGDFAKGASQIAVVARTLDHMDIFVTASDGGVYSNYWDAASGWAVWSRIDAGFASARAPVTAVARDSDHLDLFVASADGKVHTAYWNTVSGWANWSLTDAGFTKADPSFPIAVLARSATHLDVFTTGSDGAVYSSYWDDAAGWAYWFPLNTALPSAKSAVTASAVTPDHMDLFVLAASDVVYTTFWDAAGGWSNWFRVDNTFTARSGATVTSIVRAPDGLDLFVPASDGGISTTSWNSSDGGDRTWFKIDELSTLTAFNVAVLSRSPESMDIFITADDEQTDSVRSAYWDPAPGVLRKATIRFDTHDDNKDYSTAVHVFLKTRKSDSSNPNSNPTYLSNSTALARYESTGTLDGAGPNRYLASGIYLGFGSDFFTGSSHTFDLELFSEAISVNDVVLPEIDIHILADGQDQWIFDYTVTLYFDEGSYSFTSSINGVNGIILDQSNRNFTGIGTENPLRSITDPVIVKPTMAAVLTKIKLEFATHDYEKSADTTVNVHLVNRLVDGQERDMLIALDLFPGQMFPNNGTRDDQYRTISWSPTDDAFPSDVIRLSDIVLPVFYIVIYQDVLEFYERWAFDYQLTLEFTDPLSFNSKPLIFSTRYNGVLLDQSSNKHRGVYAGASFPRIAPPTAPFLSNQPIYHNGDAAKHIPLDFLQSKLDEFINSRNGGDGSANPPLRKIILTSTADSHTEGTNLTPESYADFSALINGGDGTARYVSDPLSLNQQTGSWEWLGLENTYFGLVTAESLSMFVTPHEYTPLTVALDFTPGGWMWVDVVGNIQIDSFSVNVLLTLQKLVRTNDNDNDNHFAITVADLMGWIDVIESTSDGDTQAALKDTYIDVTFVTSHHLDPGAHIRRKIRDGIYGQIQPVDVISNRARRDDINSLATSWLTGGIADDDVNADENNIVINGIGYQGTDLVIDYLGPTNVFVPEKPRNWPTGHDFSPSTLANIDHIVVLTMENRSFDHILGYLSLPVESGGMGRNDVDGLKGGESNPYKGQNFPSYELSGTLFAPGPSNAYESMAESFNGGRMDGFVKSYAEQNGDALAGNVMGYYTGRDVPAYDAVVRDFALGQRWFCSHPGSTFPNRFYELTGRPNLDPRGFWEFGNSSPIRPVFTPTIFDYLNGAFDPISGAPLTWRYFEHGYCTLRFFEAYTFNSENVVTYEDPENGFVASALSGNLPSVTFIDPHFVNYPPGSTCGEPPSDIAAGQALIREIVEAVVAGPAWNSTLLIITYDESGGFYDHVPPPSAPRVSDDFPIFTVGGRIPTMVVSPWVKPGSVFGSDAGDFFFDHTSVLKTIVRRFLPNDPPYLGARFAAANDLSSVLSTAPQNPQFLPFIRYRFEFVASGLSLDYGQTDRARKAVFHQAPADGSSAQDFSFEDAGDGYVYVRGVMNNLYVTALADNAEPVMDVKTGTPLQKWQFSPTDLTATTRNEFVISNQGKADLVLLPLQAGQIDSLVGLATASPTRDPFVNPNAWKVSSPLLPESTVVSTHDQ